MSSNPNPNPTPAQEEFQDLLNKNAGSDSPRVHPEDRDYAREADQSDEDEEDRFRNDQIDAAMRMPSMRGPVEGGNYKLPPAAFDSGRATGVKGVIADARAYEEARQTRWRDRVRAARRSVFGMGNVGNTTTITSKGSQSEGSDDELDADEEAFLQQWREARRQELEKEAQGGIRNRRTSPSLRMFGRMDTVDALGYLDAIEKVGRETVVVVFVYDNECQVSELIHQAMRPLVAEFPYVHFVKIHYEDIEFDAAAVPTVLAYKNQGDLFANLTGIIDMIPEDDDFDTDSLKRIFQKHSII
ncbi:hypothetical protein JX265_009262 [Neoarthrinium moseri]|uniref:Phosducin domain-containing protein n=1 Tax=Neoarthrinium moseri TaxID=1658444 RepID=A0A9Q0ALJ9_9PEZI|nr:uncharacterized protein JN550_006570 [Neoarthrinium moseri]KAI1847834.1 hypothetical protein JX266_006329 [Neoarthrinium moseri]KAI1862548.1 hypothetical protein JX265_009262 [Neoarthrinium moseri]KAI1868082.1 hypothetical protein JN550_006570 [Neoarthrinium moseri]